MPGLALLMECSPCPQLVNAGEDVLVFYNDRASFQTLVQMMRSERDRMDENSPLMYHIHLVELLAVCTEGKNVYTEIKCNSLLPLDDIVRVVTHEDCIPEVRARRRAGLCVLETCWVWVTGLILLGLAWQGGWCRWAASWELQPFPAAAVGTPSQPGESS